MDFYVGADWDTETAVCCVGKHRALQPQYETVKLDPEVVGRFFDKLAQLGATKVVIAIESGHELWVRLLHGCAREGVSVDVHVIDGKRARRFAESLSVSGAQDDPRSAEALFEMAQSPKHRRQPWKPLSDGSMEIARVCRMHSTLSREVVRVVNRLRADLNTIAPALNTLFKDMTRVWVRKLLRVAPTPAHFRALTDEQRGKLKFGKTSPAAVAQAYAAWELGKDDAWRADTVLMWLDQLDLLCIQRMKMEKRLTKCVAADPIGAAVLELAGVGPKIAAGLVEHALDGDLRIRDGAGIATGVAPVTRRSGKRGRQKVLTTMRRAGSVHARNVGYQLGLQAVRHMPWARVQHAYYTRTKSIGAAGSIRRVARSLMRMITAIVRDGTDYDEQRYIRTLISRGVPWAADLQLLLKPAIPA